MVISILLLLVLLIAGLLKVYLYIIPSKKVHAWLQYYSNYFVMNKNPPTYASAIIPPQVLSGIEDKNCDKKAELCQVFATFDKNGDGFITKQELRESLKNIRIIMTEKEVEEIVLKVDSNGDGLIDFEEFCLLCEAMVMGPGKGQSSQGGVLKEGDEEEDLKEAFDVFDKDKDGLISVEELESVLSSLGLKQGRKAGDCKEMIRKVDVDGDGMVNFDEFKRMMRSGGKLLSVL